MLLDYVVYVVVVIMFPCFISLDSGASGAFGAPTNFVSEWGEEERRQPQRT